MGQRDWPEGDRSHAGYVRVNQQLFAAVRNRWTDQAPEQAEAYLESTKAWIELQRDLRENENLVTCRATSTPSGSPRSRRPRPRRRRPPTASAPSCTPSRR